MPNQEHFPRHHDIPIGTVLGSPDSAFVGVIKKDSIFSALFLFIENFGPATITLKAFASNDNGAADAWAAINLYTEAGVGATSRTLVEKGKACYHILSTEKPYIKFEATPINSAYGRLVVTHYGGSIERRFSAANAPAAPSALTITQTSDTVLDLSWTDNSNDEREFHVERSPDNTVWTEIGVVGAGVTKYKDTGLTQNTQYYYRVRASNGDIYSTYATANAFTLLAAPSGLVASSVAISGRIDLVWVDNASGETSQSIERSDDGATGWAEVLTPAANATTANQTGLTPGQTKYYRARAIKSGVNSLYSNISSAVVHA